MALYHRIRPLLFRLDAERAHVLAVLMARMAQRVTPTLIQGWYEFGSARLATRVLGIPFTNPVGIAAGFDKNGVMTRFWNLAGSGFMEIGSVSDRSCRGNPKPRAFRLPDDEALINRMGLNNQGADRVGNRVAKARKLSGPLGINLVKTHDPSISGNAAIADFASAYRRLAPVADYTVLNLSCPNTTEGRTFEDPNALDDLLHAVFEVRREVAPNVPVLLKLGPPVSDRVVLDSEIEEIVAVATAHGVAGFVACNTAPDRDGLRTAPETLERIGNGGLSGRPIADRSHALVRYLYRKTRGTMPIIGVGGIASGEEAYRRIRAGASLVQVYTGLVYEGPGLIARIKRDLDALLIADGFSAVSKAVGADT